MVGSFRGGVTSVVGVEPSSLVTFEDGRSWVPLAASGDRDETGDAEGVEDQDDKGVDAHPEDSAAGPEEQAEEVDEGEQEGEGSEVGVGGAGPWQRLARR